MRTSAPPECDLAARDAIAIIRDTVSAYVYVTVDVDTFAEGFEPIGLGGLYRWSAPDVLALAGVWCASNPDVEEVHYFFEDGAEGQASAKAVISDLMGMPYYRADCRYSGMSFVPKAKSPGVQAADLIAWHTGKDAKRAIAGQEMRKDFAALIADIPAYGYNWTAPALKSFRAVVLELARDCGLPVEKLPEIVRLVRQNRKK